MSATTGLSSTIDEILQYKSEAAARKLGVCESDIRFSRLCGIDPRDVRVFKEFTKRGYLIVVRCPKLTALGKHGLFPAKPASWSETETKSHANGLAFKDGQIRVSDYDLMSVWKAKGKGFEKIFVSAVNGQKRGPFSKVAKDLVVALNKNLVSKIQHGCQDDYNSPANRGVRDWDNYVAFKHGVSYFLLGSKKCHAFYKKAEIQWPYDENGNFKLKFNLPS